MLSVKKIVKFETAIYAVVRKNPGLNWYIVAEFDALSQAQKFISNSLS